MPGKQQKFEGNGFDVKIPNEYIERIDKIVNTGRSVYPSRNDFIQSAIEIKLAELKRTGLR